MLVVSLVGVVLIARPPFLFWDSGIPEDAPEAIDPLVVIRAISEGSATERMMAVGHVAFICERIEAHVTPVLHWSALPVLQAHVSRNIASLPPDLFRRFLDISVRAIGKRAHAMHVLAYYALFSVLAAALG
jgi:hypothetical protein